MVHNEDRDFLSGFLSHFVMIFIYVRSRHLLAHLLTHLLKYFCLSRVILQKKKQKKQKKQLPANKNVLTSSNISLSVRPSPFSDCAVKTMSRKSSFFFPAGISFLSACKLQYCQKDESLSVCCYKTSESNITPL